MKTKKNKKIILLSNTAWYIYNFRLDLLKLIRSKGFDVYIICPFDKYKEKIEDMGFKVYEWHLKRNSINPINELVSIYNLLTIYQRIKPDIVHHFTIKASIYGSICSWICKTKTTINSFTGLGHLFISNENKITLIRNIISPILKLVFSKKDTKLIFQNSSDRNHLINLKLVTKNNSYVIPGSGINVSYFKPSKKNDGDKFLKILFPSRLIREKGIFELIKACSILWEKKVPIKLFIAGKLDKGNRSCLTEKDIKKLNKQKYIYLIGHVEDMRSIYKSVDIVVLPSWREGLSKALLEAASMEKAIITTNVPGCREIIDHMKSGLLVKKNNPLHIKDSILKLYNEKDLIKKFGKAARIKVKKEFEIKKINNMTITLYE
tara:strand:- start:4714 stop:5844 length:1131 start_codon:yes stop_codon:yes gene_type:complete